MDGPRVLNSNETVDGVLFAEIQNRWTLQGGTWILQGTDLTSYVNGKAVKLTITATPTGVASLSGVGRAKSLLAHTGYAALSLMIPAPAYASCTTATLVLVSTSGALAIALATPGLDILALMVAQSAYLAAVSDYADQCGTE
jgi:hypothetical protein